MKKPMKSPFLIIGVVVVAGLLLASYLYNNTQSSSASLDGIGNALHVSIDGDDNNPGTREQPLRSIGHAIDLAAEYPTLSTTTINVLGRTYLTTDADYSQLEVHDRTINLVALTNIYTRTVEIVQNPDFSQPRIMQIGTGGGGSLNISGLKIKVPLAIRSNNSDGVNSTRVAIEDNEFLIDNPIFEHTETPMLYFSCSYRAESECLIRNNKFKIYSGDGITKMINQGIVAAPLSGDNMQISGNEFIFPNVSTRLSPLITPLIGIFSQTGSGTVNASGNKFYNEGSNSGDRSEQQVGIMIVGDKIEFNIFDNDFTRFFGIDVKRI